jgi:putative membrane protein
VSDPVLRQNNKIPWLLLGSYLLVLIWSVIKPKEYITWFLEVLPALIGITVLVVTYRRCQLTTLAYTLIWGSAIIMTVGGHYTYADVPLFNWVRDAWGLSRNHYDRVGHVMHGLTAAIVVREVLIRYSPVPRGWWLVFLVLACCFASNAIYELVEFAVAQVSGMAADAFLGTQGDEWDSHRDILMGFCGALLALSVLKPLHDRQLARKGF